MRIIWFYIKFFLKGGYINSFRSLKISPGAWTGKCVSIFFEKPTTDNQTITLGRDVKIGHFSDLYVGRNNAIVIKDFTTINTHCKIAGDVTIERYCLLSANILISSGAHYATKFPHLLIRQQDARVLSSPEGLQQHSKPIHIEEDVWIGVGVYIKHGVSIGRGAVIGANSVVLNDVAPYEIVAGAPAKKIKSRLNFNPPSFITASREQDLPYFYRGFDHFNVNNLTPSGDIGIRSYGQSTIAIAKVNAHSIVCKGFLVCPGLISIRISLDGSDLGNYELEGGTFELKILKNHGTPDKVECNNYSFITFEVSNNKSLCFGINSIKLVDPV